MTTSVREIYQLYGGFAQIIRSPYVKSSLVLALAMWPNAVDGRWTDIALSILPSITGFSIAALAIVTTIGDDNFRQKMANVDGIKEGESDLLIVMASIIWFIFIQVAAIIFARIFVSKPINLDIVKNFTPCNIDTLAHFGNVLYGSLGLFLSIYALLLVVSTVLQMFYIFKLYIGIHKSNK